MNSFDSDNAYKKRNIEIITSLKKNKTKRSFYKFKKAKYFNCFFQELILIISGFFK